MELEIHTDVLSELEDSIHFFRITPRPILIDRLKCDLQVSDLQATAMADILLDEQLSAIQALAEITEVLGLRNKYFTTSSPTTSSTELRSTSMSTTPHPHLSKTQNAYYSLKIALEFRTEKGANHFNSWHNKILSTHAKDLIKEGFLNALNEQQRRKYNEKAPLFSKLVIKEEKRLDREPLLPNNFEVDYLPDDVKVKYFVNNELVEEPQFPVVTLTKDNSIIEVHTKFDANESRYSMSRTHNFVRYLAYHCNSLSLVPPLDPQAIKDAVKDLIRVKKMIGIKDLVKTLKKEFKLFSHPTGCPRGVLLWGPPGTGKTYIISSLLTLLGITPVSDPLAAGDFLRGIVGESELMINEIAKRARAVPWMLTAISIDEIDGLVPSRQGPAASGGSINLLSVLLSIIGGNKDTPNLVLFGSTNRYESMDEAFLRRMNTKSFIGRPSAQARREWVEKNLLDTGKIVLQVDKQKFLSEVSKLTVNFSNDAMRVFIKFMETHFNEEAYVVTGQNYEEFRQRTLQNILSVSIAERILIADTYLPNLIKTWGKFERNAEHRFPARESFLSYAPRKKYTKALPRIFLDMNAKSGQVQIKESRRQEDLTMMLKRIREHPFSYLGIKLISEKLKELGTAENELQVLIDEMFNQHNNFSTLLDDASKILFDNNNCLVDKATLNLRLANEIVEAPLKSSAIVSMWQRIIDNFRPRDEIPKDYFIQMLLCIDEAQPFRQSVTNFITATERAFSLESKVLTFSVMKHMDAGEFDHEEALHLLFQFVVHGDFGCFHYIDASYLYRKGITEENMAIRHIAAAVEEARQYPSAMIAIDLDSISEVHKEVTGLKTEMKTPHTDMSGGFFGPSISYRPQKSALMNMVLELAKSNTPVWIAIICKHPYLTEKFKETLNWWTENERAQQEEALKKDQDLKVDKKCKYCHEYFTEAENKLNSCGRHQSPDSLFIDEHYENAEQKILRRYTRAEAESIIRERNIPRNRVHYFCCGRSIDDKGELPDKHFGDPVP